MGGILHRKQLWFHGPISRDESEYRIRNYGVRDGLFLVRERTQVNSFALCVSFRSEVYHYLLDMNTLGQLSIENGRKFENLLQVVDHYSRTPDGLLCALDDVCPVTVFEDGGPSRDQARVKHGPRRIERSEIEVFDTLGELDSVARLLLYLLHHVIFSGAGTFGAVRAAMYRPKNGEPHVECAVKCLKTDHNGTNEKVRLIYIPYSDMNVVICNDCVQSEILREADAMASLDHPYIVRLYGKSCFTVS